MNGLLVLAASIAAAFFLGRGLEPWRPTDLKRLTIVGAAGMAAPLAIVHMVEWAASAGGRFAMFLSFAGGVVLISCMVLASAWTVRFLAEQLAQSRSS